MLQSGVRTTIKKGAPEHMSKPRVAMSAYAGSGVPIALTEARMTLVAKKVVQSRC